MRQKLKGRLRRGLAAVLLGPLAAGPALAEVTPVQFQAPGPLENFIGNWRYPEGWSCQGGRYGTVVVEGDVIRFIWQLPNGRRNLAEEKIIGIEGNRIMTRVAVDVGSRNNETGDRFVYTVNPDSWTSMNLRTGALKTHRRC
ncbi:hypothetical protein [Muricoccus radiodurans]|uniref:hypothetical protein n=1 Tax=Muricoccus radiodurans TaxID=2231721 RepID=UPI003CF1B533